MTKYTWKACKIDSDEVLYTGEDETYRDYKAWRKTIQTLNKDFNLSKGTKLKVVLVYKNSKMIRIIEIGKDWTQE